MMNKIVAIGIVAVLIIAGFLFLGYGTGDAEGGDEEIVGDVNVTIEEVNSDVAYTAQVDIGNTNMAEQMMLTAFGGIRQSDFKPLYSFTDDAGALKGASSYVVSISSTLKLTGTNIASIVSTEVTLEGQTGDGTYLLSYGSATDVIWKTNPTMVLGTSSTLSSAPFMYKRPNSAVTTLTSIYGNDIAGKDLVFVLGVKITALDYNGVTVTVNKMVDLQVTASLVASGTMGVEITDMHW